MVSDTLINKWFEGYVNQFRDEAGAWENMLELKYNHCHRVSQEAATIARALEWSEHDIALGQGIGLLHDVGRFTQFREFGTIHDLHSVDHGERGFEVLSGEKELAGMLGGNVEVVLNAVRFHNRRSIPDSLGEESRRFTLLVRDADKLDALRIMSEATQSGDLQRHPEMVWNVPMEGPVSPELLGEVLRGQVASYGKVRTLADFRLVMLSWAFDLNFSPTRALIRDRGYFPQMASWLPGDALITDALARVNSALDQV